MNPKKEDRHRIRDCQIGVGFPRGRLAEVREVADANGLTVSAWVRMVIMQRLDAIKAEKVDKMVV